MVHVGRRGSPFGTSADRRPSASSPSSPAKVRTSERGRKSRARWPRAAATDRHRSAAASAAPPPPSPAGTETLRPIPRTASAGPAVTSSATVLEPRVAARPRRPPPAPMRPGHPDAACTPLAAASKPTSHPETSNSVSAPRSTPTWPSPARPPVTRESSTRNRPGSRVAPFAAGALANTTGAGLGATARAVPSAGFAARSGLGPSGAAACGSGQQQQRFQRGDDIFGARHRARGASDRRADATADEDACPRRGDIATRAQVSTSPRPSSAPRMRAGRSGHRARTSASASTRAGQAAAVGRRAAGWCRRFPPGGENRGLSRSREHGFVHLLSGRPNPSSHFSEKCLDPDAGHRDGPDLSVAALRRHAGTVHAVEGQSR